MDHIILYLQDYLATIGDLVVLVIIYYAILPLLAKISRKVLFNQTLGMLFVSIVSALAYYLLQTESIGGEKTTMTAATYGPNNVFGVSTEMPIPNYNKKFGVLIKIKAASINPVDYKINKSRIPIARWFLKPTFVFDISGTVIAKGSHSSCDRFEINDEVFGVSVLGGLAEYAVSLCIQVGKKDKKLSFEEAASLPTVSVGYSGFYSDLKVAPKYFGKGKPKQTVIVIGASGGCGLYGVNLIKRFENVEIIAIASGKNKDLVMKNGADIFLDYRASDFNEQVKKYHGKVDFVYDTVTSFEDMDYYPIIFPTLKNPTDTKRYLAINGMYQDWIGMFIYVFSFKLIDIQRPSFELLSVTLQSDDFEDIGKIAVEPNVNLATIYKTYKGISEKNVKEAFALLKGRRSTGKIVFSL